MFSAFFTNLKDRRKRDIPDREPEDLITLYNSALDHLMDVLKDPHLPDLCFPHEPSCATSLEDINNIVDQVEMLRLPELLVHDSTTWKNIVDQVLVYLDRIYVAGEDASVTVSSVKSALARSYRSYNSKCQTKIMFSPEENFAVGGIPPVELLPWTDIVHAYATYKLSTLRCEQSVWYNTNMLDTWQYPTSWTRGYSYNEERKNKTVTEIVDDTINEAREKSLNDVTMTDVSDHCHHPALREALKEEQKQNLR